MAQILSPVLMMVGGEPTVWCPGCKMIHRFNVNAPNQHTGARWTWDGNVNSPTFHPSMNIDMGKWQGKEKRCHSFVQNGMWVYCSDTTHEFSGQTIPLPSIPEDEKDWPDV